MTIKSRTAATAFALALLAVLALSTASFAATAGALTFAVFPFQVKGPEKYKYLDKGIQSMLASRLTWKGHFEPVDSGEVDRYLREHPAKDTPSQLEAIKTLGELGAEYLFTGTTTVIGDKAAVDVLIQGKDGKSWKKQADTTLTQLIPSLDRIAKEITAELFKRPGTGAADKKAQVEEKIKNEQDTPANPAFVYGETGQPTGEGAINPRFRYQSSPDTPGRWRSQGLPYAADCSLAADLDHDGLTEIFIVGDHKIRAYHVEQGRLLEKGSMDISNRDQPLRLSAMDIDNDGVEELILSCINEEQAQPNSSVLSYQQGVFTAKYDNIHFYLNVVAMPPFFSKTLIGQDFGAAKPFKAKSIQEVDITGGGFRLARKVRLPENSNAFNFCYLPAEDGTVRILVIGPYGRLRLYSEDLTIIYQTEETFNGSSLAINVIKKVPGLGNPAEDARQYDTYYVPMPITVSILGNSKRSQVLVSKDISIATQFFDSYRSFSESEIHSMYWDGIGLNLLWKTRRIKGTTVNYGIADIDNDGGLDLWISLNTYPGALGLEYRKTLILGYPLDLPSDTAASN
ncbi:MAG: hypothetical protein PWQ57_2127 [Desulfovibrionales bacterium]|nr:hypothetical protein [Desulfovibrionales bacterium]